VLPKGLVCLLSSNSWSLPPMMHLTVILYNTTGCLVVMVCAAKGGPGTAAAHQAQLVHYACIVWFVALGL
jgi:hypothetical protein